MLRTLRGHAVPALLRWDLGDARRSPSLDFHADVLDELRIGAILLDEQPLQVPHALAQNVAEPSPRTIWCNSSRAVSASPHRSVIPPVTVSSMTPP